MIAQANTSPPNVEKKHVVSVVISCPVMQKIMLAAIEYMIKITNENITNFVRDLFMVIL